MKPYAYTIGNFKAISEPQTLLLRPATLIFGQNSAGKSSIIQSLLLCQQAIRKGSFDISSVTRWGQRIDLGGFRQYIHKHDVSQDLRIGFDFVRTQDEWEGSPLDIKVERELSDLPKWAFCYFNAISEIGMRITVGLSEKSYKQKDPVPVIKQLELSIDGEPVMIFSNNQKTGLQLTKLNLENSPVVAAMGYLLREYLGLEENEMETLEGLFGKTSASTSEASNSNLESLANKTFDEMLAAQDWATPTRPEDMSPEDEVINLLGQSAAFAEFAHQLSDALEMEMREPKRLLTLSGDGLNLQLDPARRVPGSRYQLRNAEDESDAETGTAMGKMEEIEAIENPSRFFTSDPDSEGDFIQGLAKAFRYDLEATVEACLDSLSYWLQQTEYIGPFRAIPERFFQISKDTDNEEVDQGYQALRRIANDPNLVMKITNIFQDTLNCPYRLESRTVAPALDLRQLEDKLQRARENVGGGDGQADFIRETIAALSEGRTKSGVFLVDTRNEAEVDFCDVGFGIGQVLPLIAELIKEESGLVCIEQPEVHLHPKMQSDLADVIIDSLQSQKDDKLLIMETHSEHIILRLLRRIRELNQKKTNLGNGFTQSDLSVVWVSAGPDGSQLKRLEVDERGRFVDDWPQGFFEERLDELF